MKHFTVRKLILPLILAAATLPAGNALAARSGAHAMRAAHCNGTGTHARTARTYKARHARVKHGK